MASKGKYDAKMGMAMSQGSARRAHFAAGGSVAMWNGRNARFQDARKVASKKACRGRSGRGDE